MGHSTSMKKRYITSLAALFMAGTFLATTGNASADTTDNAADTTQVASNGQSTTQNQAQTSNVIVLQGGQTQAETADQSSSTATDQQNSQTATTSDTTNKQTPDVINKANVTASDADTMTIAGASSTSTQKTPTTLVGKIAADVNDKVTDVTTGLAADVIFPLGFSRQGSSDVSAIRDILDPDRYDTSAAYEDLDEQYDPAAAKTFFDTAQNWWDNEAVKQTLTIPSSNFAGETSTATYVANPNSKKTVIIGQGWTERPDWVGLVSAVWYTMGYNVLMPSSRGQFAGDGNYIPFGYYDSQDWKTWVQQADNLAGADEEVVYYGQSMGAATSLDAAADPDLPSNVKAVIADCSFSTLASLGKSLYDKVLDGINTPLNKLPIPITLDSIPLVPYDKTIAAVDKLNVEKQGFDLDNASPLNAVQHITIPTYFITTEDDNFIPDSESVALYNASSAPIKKLWVLDGEVGGHASAEGAVTEYQQNIQGFLNEVDQANTTQLQVA